MSNPFTTPLIVVAILVAGIFVFTTCVDTVNAKEPTTLDKAVNRPPPVIQTHVDKERGVVCYWVDTRSISCIKTK
jgi:hypothetical protein